MLNLDISSEETLPLPGERFIMRLLAASSLVIAIKGSLKQALEECKDETNFGLYKVLQLNTPCFPRQPISAIRPSQM